MDFCQVDGCLVLIIELIYFLNLCIAISAIENMLLFK